MNPKKPRPNCLVCDKECNEWHAKYCSDFCHKAHLKDKYLIDWINNPEKVFEKTGLCPRPIKQFLREMYDNQCQLCGWNKINPTTGIVPLEVNHIDGNGFNNRLENLQLICPNCHSLTPNFKALNKNGSRKNRK